jgi:hypothetical protein
MVIERQNSTRYTLSNDHNIMLSVIIDKFVIFVLIFQQTLKLVTVSENIYRKVYKNFC